MQDDAEAMARGKAGSVMRRCLNLICNRPIAHAMLQWVRLVAAEKRAGLVMQRCLSQLQQHRTRSAMLQWRAVAHWQGLHEGYSERMDGLMDGLMKQLVHEREQAAFYSKVFIDCTIMVHEREQAAFYSKVARNVLVNGRSHSTPDVPGSVVSWLTHPPIHPSADGFLSHGLQKQACSRRTLHRFIRWARRAVDGFVGQSIGGRNDEG
jgi:hypothetical protein